MKVRGQVVFVDPSLQDASDVQAALERWFRFLSYRDMSLSAVEMDQARRALREVLTFQKRRQYWISNAWLLLFFFFQILDHIRHPWIWMCFGVFLAGCFTCRLFYDRRLGARYAGNMELLRIFSEREPGLLDSLPDPFAYPPLLEAWNRRLGQRALLWRLDSFLSGKGWPKN